VPLVVLAARLRGGDRLARLRAAALVDGDIAAVAYSVILTWVYVGTGGSVLMTGLFHALIIGLTPLTNGLDPLVAWDISGIVFPIVAILVIALGGLRGLQASRDDQPALA
jgi:hypothetical protein